MLTKVENKDGEAGARSIFRRYHYQLFIKYASAKLHHSLVVLMSNAPVYSILNRMIFVVSIAPFYNFVAAFDTWSDISSMRPILTGVGIVASFSCPKGSTGTMTTGLTGWTITSGPTSTSLSSGYGSNGTTGMGCGRGCGYGLNG